MIRRYGLKKHVRPTRGQSRFDIPYRTVEENSQRKSLRNLQEVSKNTDESLEDGLEDGSIYKEKKQGW